MKVIAMLAAAVLCMPISAGAEWNAETMYIVPGMDRDAVHEVINGGKETSNGLKEVYELGNGEYAVMHYCGDTLLRVYILERRDEE